MNRPPLEPFAERGATGLLRVAGTDGAARASCGRLLAAGRRSVAVTLLFGSAGCAPLRGDVFTRQDPGSGQASTGSASGGGTTPLPDHDGVSGGGSGGGGGGSDAGTDGLGAAGLQAEGGGGAAPWCPSGALYCENFDGEPPPLSQATPGTARLDGTHPHSAPFDLLSETSGAGWGRVEVNLPSALTQGTIGTRAWVYVEPGASAGAVVLWALHEPTDYGQKLSLDLHGDGSLTITCTVASDAVGATSSPGVLAPGAWHCVSFEVRLGLAGEDTLARVEVDGSLVAELPPGAATVPPDGLGRFMYGIEAGISEQPLAVHQDDVVLARAPVPCP